MNENLGVYADLQAKREAMAARMSPQARHAAFPAVYARPETLVTSNDLKRINAALSEKVRALEASNAALDKEVKALRKAVATSGVPVMDTLPMGDVINMFCVALAKTSYAVDDQPITKADLISPYQARPYAYPRHVAMWLCRRLCPTYYSAIGREFGRRDHTTVMHACRRAPHILEGSPELKAAAQEVMDTFRDRVTP